MKNIRIGDVVIPKSGGPKMTLCEIIYDLNNFNEKGKREIAFIVSNRFGYDEEHIPEVFVNCCGFKENDDFFESTFDLSLLEKVE
jgi:uncharacterized protein YodC (DUF2158 family)